MKTVELVELLDEVVRLEVEQSADDNDSVDGRRSGSSDMRRQHSTRCSWSAKTSESVAESGRCRSRTGEQDFRGSVRRPPLPGGDEEAVAGALAGAVEGAVEGAVVGAVAGAVTGAVSGSSGGSSGGAVA